MVKLEASVLKALCVCVCVAVTEADVPSSLTVPASSLTLAACAETRRGAERASFV